MIALIPVRDEEWTLRRCLATASLWADHIIVADQHSGDRSVEIARSFPKVTLIENRDREFSEVSRQRQLIDAARHLCAARRVLVGIDADEILSANVLGDPRWEAAIRAPAGTQLRYTKVLLWTDPENYFYDMAVDRGVYIPFAYVDDGFPHEGGLIHTSRVPQPDGGPTIDVPEIAVIHYSHCNPEREESKGRWYQCFERIHYPERTVVEIHRRYDWIARLRPTFQIRPVRPEWFKGWLEAGIDLSASEDGATLWCEPETLRLFVRYGTKPFRFLNVWTVDWESARQRALARGMDGLGDEPILIPSSLLERGVRRLLAHHPPSRWVDGALRRFCRFIEY